MKAVIITIVIALTVTVNHAMWLSGPAPVEVEEVNPFPVPDFPGNPNFPQLPDNITIYR